MKTLLTALLVMLPCIVVAQSKPQPGDLYRDFSLHNGGNRDWRVTDADAVKKFPAAEEHLPNSVLQLKIEDLEHAIRAEMILDRWGGHRGTINKRVRFNEKAWIVVPELAGTPDDIRPEHLMFQDNPVVDVPIEDLISGVNSVEADCDEEGGFGWGQWGLYSLTVRVYYDRNAKGEKFQSSGTILSPTSGATIGDHPTLSVQADAAMGVARIDILASYDGYDEDGDGIHDGYHESHFQLTSGEPNEIRDHVGTMWRMPYRTTWDTHWVPDQSPRSISLIARVQDSRGYWSVTEPVENLSLERDDVSVRIFRASGVPEDFAVRVDDEKKSCEFQIDDADFLKNATESALHVRTWHGWDGHHEPLRLNQYEMPINGKNHFYDYDLLEFPTEVLQPGRNTFTIASTTEHHMLEVLWPGPAIVVRASKPKVKISESSYEDRDHFVIQTSNVEFWLDKASGGMSRLIDKDGNDWIGFRDAKSENYPESSANRFRGMPNVLHGGEEGGFGHPGWDRGTSQITGENQITSTSTSGDWKLVWTFRQDGADLSVQTRHDDTPFWFLYEGTPAGRFAPQDQYIATNTMRPSDQSMDFYAGERHVGRWDWVYVGDRLVDRVLLVQHQTSDDGDDTFSHLGNTTDGIHSPDGMVVLGFGRGPDGIDPQLRGPQSFRIRFLETAGQTVDQYKTIARQLSDSDLPSNDSKTDSMPLHPQSQAFVDNLAANSPPGWEQLSPAEGRAAFAGLAELFGRPIPLPRVENHVLPSGVPIRFYASSTDDEVPLVMYFHGGGWVLGDLDTHDALCRNLAARSGCNVVSVGYGLSPENAFPGPIDDCYEATRYVIEHAQQFSIRPDAVAVAGDSAGGHLAAAVAIRARDQSGPKIHLQVLIYPVIEPDFQTPSYEQFASGHGLTRSAMQYFWDQFAGKQIDQPSAVPSRAASHAGLPAAHVITAQYDVLRDGGEAYAEKLSAAGVSVTRRRYDGMLHGFVHLSSLFDIGDQAITDIAEVLKQKLK